MIWPAQADGSVAQYRGDLLVEIEDAGLVEKHIATAGDHLFDNPISLVRGCRSMSGSQQGNGGIIALALDALQLGATDHMRLRFHSG